MLATHQIKTARACLRRPAFSPSCDDDQVALRAVHEKASSSLCSIVGIDGSFSRRLGCQLAIDSTGATFGSLSDGCLEHELATRAAALKVSRSGPVTLRFGKGSPFIDFRLPCGSGLDIHLDPEPDRVAISETIERLDARIAVSMVLRDVGQNRTFRRTYTPSLRLVICGAGPEARMLETVATTLGIATAKAGPQSGLRLGGAPDWLPLDQWTAVVLLFHDHEWERAILDWALASNAFYIGAMGGRRAREDRQTLLSNAGHSPKQIARMHSPIGLIRSAREPGLLALAILSEVCQAYEDNRIAQC